MATGYSLGGGYLAGNDYREYRSLREAVFRQLEENQYLSLSAQMKKIRRETLFRHPKYQTVKNYRSEWRSSYPLNGLVPKAQHYGYGCLDANAEFGADPNLWERAVCCGWRESRNRNRERWHRVGRVSLAWSRCGTVRFHFKGALPKSYLLTAFSSAFWSALRTWERWSEKSDNELAEYIRALFFRRFRWGPHHSTYETGVPLPRLVIRDRKRSHGETIKLGDGSHPTKLEIEETEPFWASGLKKSVEKLDFTVGKIDGVIDKFGENLNSHMELIKTWREENENHRLKGGSCFDDAVVKELLPIAEPEPGCCARCNRKRTLQFCAVSINSSCHRICSDCARVLGRSLSKRLSQ